MSDTTTVEDDQQTDDSSVIKKLRKQLADLTAERDDLKAGARQRAFTDAGVTEAGRKAMDKLYDGDLDGDQIRSFAQDNGIALAAEETGDAGDTQSGVAPDVSDEEQARRAATQRVNGATNIGTTPPPANAGDDLNNKITEAEEAGDVRTSVALKAQKLERMRANA